VEYSFLKVKVTMMNSGLFSGLSLNNSVYIGIGMRAETVPAVKITTVTIRHNPINVFFTVFIYFLLIFHYILYEFHDFKCLYVILFKFKAYLVFKNRHH
jgi:hypothetical protein